MPKGKLTNERISAILQEEISRAAGSDLEGGQLVANRENATEYALGRKAGGTPPPGTSGYVSQDVGDAIDAIIGELLPSFSGDVVARFEENGPDDQTASAESDVVSEFIMDRNPGTVILHNAIWSMLAHKNGICKVWIEDERTADPREFPDKQTAIQAQAIGEAQGLEIEREGTTVSAIRHEQKLRIDTIEPEHFIYAANHRSIFLDGIRFCGEICYHTRSALHDLGVPRALIRKLAAAGVDTKADSVVKRVGGASGWNDSNTWDQQEIRCVSAYRLMPERLNEGAVTSELWWFLYASDTNTVLLKEKASFLPYCAGAAWLIPGRFEGVSAYDKLASVADAKSDGIRQILENLRAANNGKTAHNDRIDPDDVLNQRAANTIPVDGNGPVGDAIMQLGATDVITQGLGLIQYLDSVRTERVGASIDLSSPEFQVMGDTAHGTERMMSAREVRSGKNALMIAETLVRSLWLLVHKTLRRKWNGPVMVTQSGQWQEVDPASWPQRDRVNVTHGMSPGERVRKGQALGVVAQYQTQMMQGGLNGILVDNERIYNTALDTCRAMGIEAPERHFMDPSSQASQQAQQAQAQQAQQAQQKQDQITQLTLKLEQMDRDLKKQELVFKYWDAKLASDTDLAEAGMKSGTDLELGEIAAANGNENTNSPPG